MPGKKRKAAGATFEVESIVEKKMEDGEPLYRIRWKGYGPDDDTWEPPRSFSDSSIVARFEAGKGSDAADAPQPAVADSRKSSHGESMDVGALHAPGLWEPCKAEALGKLPDSLSVLDVFAGCGGLFMEGSVSFRKSDPTLSVQTVAAVELMQDPATTYKRMHPDVNVMRIGISRFLATARRLTKLRDTPASAIRSGEAVRVLGLRLDANAVAEKGGPKKETASTRDRQVCPRHSAHSSRRRPSSASSVSCRRVAC